MERVDGSYPDLEAIQNFIRIFDASDAHELVVEVPSFRIRLAKAEAGSVVQANTTGKVIQEETGSEYDDPETYFLVRSPLTGIFYRRPKPELPPFVEENQFIGVGTVLCMIETMKIYNEFPSEGSGLLERIVAQDKNLVQAGELLMVIDKTKQPPESPVY